MEILSVFKFVSKVFKVMLMALKQPLSKSLACSRGAAAENAAYL